MTTPTDADVIKGSPMDPNPAAPAKDTPAPSPAAPKMVEVEISGQKVMVPEVFVDQFSAMQSQITDLSAKVSAATRPAPTKPDAPAIDDPFADIDTLMFSNPKEAARLIAQQAVKQSTDLVRSEQSASRDREAFWKEFYAEHKDLDSDVDGPVVEAIFAREFSRMADMKVSEAIKHLGTVSKAQLLKIAQKRGAPTNGKPKPTSEPGNEPSPGGSKPTNTDASTHQPGTLADHIRQRRAARMKAAKA